MNNDYYGKCKSYSVSDIIGGVFYDKITIDTVLHRSNGIGKVLKSRLRETIFQQLTIWYPINQSRFILNMIYKIYPHRHNRNVPHYMSLFFFETNVRYS